MGLILIPRAGGGWCAKVYLHSSPLRPSNAPHLSRTGLVLLFTPTCKPLIRVLMWSAVHHSAYFSLHCTWKRLLMDYAFISLCTAAGCCDGFVRKQRNKKTRVQKDKTRNSKILVINWMWHKICWYQIYPSLPMLLSRHGICPKFYTVRFT